MNLPAQKTRPAAVVMLSCNKHFKSSDDSVQISKPLERRAVQLWSTCFSATPPWKLGFWMSTHVFSGDQGLSNVQNRTTAVKTGPHSHSGISGLKEWVC